MNQNKFRSLSQLALLLAPVLLSVACSKMSADASKLASKAGDTVGCQSFQESFWHELYKFPQDKKRFPTEEEMRASFDKATEEGRLANLSQADRIRVADALTELYRLLALDSVKTLGVPEEDDEATLSTLTALEIGDRTTDEKSAVQDQIQKEFAKVQSIVESSGLPACTTPKPDSESGPASGTLFADWKAKKNPTVYGALKTFAVAYQSCDATGNAALSLATPDVKGITASGMHSDGIGRKRTVTSLSSLLASHPYLKNYSRPNSSCFEVTKTPLIYDYGGKPAVSSSANSFDLFKNAGSGTSTLGIDCSGYVYMSLASAGLRIKKETSARAVTVSGISSRMFLDPQRNGMSCLDFARFSKTESLKPGDIIAKSGHVFVIGSVGTDPFGIAGIKSVGDCTAKNLPVSRFDFTVLQSSTSKNGIGIHAHKASSYLPESDVFSAGLQAHAVNACKAKFASSSVTTKVSTVSVVRHSGEANCKDKEVAIERQSCVASCPAVARTAALESDDFASTETPEQF